MLTPYLGPEAAVEAIVASRAEAVVGSRTGGAPPGQSGRRPSAVASANGTGAKAGAAADSGAGAKGRAAAGNGTTPAGEREDEDYRRLAERRSAKCVNTTPTSTDSTITTIKGA